MYYILWLIILLVCIVGLSEVLHSFRLLCFKTNQTKKIILFNLLENSAEFDLNYIIEEMRWNGKKAYAQRIIALNHLTSDESLNKCKEIASKYSIDIVKPSELETFLFNTEF